MNGLSSQQAQNLLKKYGPNQILSHKQNFLQKFLAKLISPITFMLMLAAILSFINHKAFDGYFILLLLALNQSIALWQERKADQAIQKLNQHLEQKIKVLRDGQWAIIESSQLVPGDLIEIALGDIAPADCRITSGKNITVNQSALTGESLPVDKKVGDIIYSGSFLSTGVAQSYIEATGSKTYFGKTLRLAEKTSSRSLLEQDILSISKFLTILSLIGVAVMSLLFIYQKAPIGDLLTLDLSLVIAGIPISLPTVMTLIIEFGVISLAPKNVVVRRLSALEDLANVNLLLTDKTGTLTQNKIEVNQIMSFGQFDQREVLQLALMSARTNPKDPINQAIIKKASSDTLPFKVLDFVPADSERKRTTVIFESNNKTYCLTLGAAHVIKTLLSPNLDTKDLDNKVLTLSQKGYRVIVAAIVQGKAEHNLELAGIITLSDTIRPEASEVIEFMRQNSIEVVMVTGDNQSIASQVSYSLKLNNGKVMTKTELDQLGIENLNKSVFTSTGAFAQVLPVDKLKLVRTAKKYFTVAANGDGINDLAAIKEANVGFAVFNAVEALKSAADIVLLSSGIGVIKDAIIESRKIFHRLYSYSLYRLSESFRLIITIVVIGIIYRTYPLTPLQLILIALLNDIPIISLAFNRVKYTLRPAKVNVTERFLLSSLFGSVGILNSLIMFFLVSQVFKLPWEMIQTLYFLKLSISGHLLIYVAHTKQRWYRFLPSKDVILATTLTQSAATILALTGILMPAKLPITWVIIIWVWSFFWMQISELMKDLQKFIINNLATKTTSEMGSVKQVIESA